MIRLFRRTIAILSLALPALAGAQTRTPEPDCAALATLRLPDTTVTSAVLIHNAAVTFKMPTLADLPAFCRVVAHVKSSPDSDIGVEVWLPVGRWAGVFHGNGNGGFAGTLAAGYGSMLSGLRRGYATATTDTGTAPATMLDADALIGHPRKWKDWGRLSTHVMTVTGKAIAQAYYGRGARKSYYTGCSTGGQQGLIEALYYPADYDGILVGAPVINRTWGHAAVVWNYAAAHRTAASFLPDAKLGLLNATAIKVCNRRGFGVPGDPFITDALACRFDPQELLCKGADADTCLTAQQVATARAFYSGPTTRDGRAKFFGWPAGSEAPNKYGWSFLQTASNGQPQFSSLFRWIFGAQWDWRSFDVNRDMTVVEARLDADVNDATRGNLRSFRARGGKLIIYHGLADSLVPPAQSVAFYQRQARELGGVARLQDTARLFMVPGVMHCGGGPGPDSFNSAVAGAPQPKRDAQHDLFTALIEWRDKGRAPAQVIATKFATDLPEQIAFKRPICAHPKIARYVGRGSTRDEKNFRCISL